MFEKIVTASWWTKWGKHSLRWTLCHVPHLSLFSPGGHEWDVWRVGRCRRLIISRVVSLKLMYLCHQSLSVTTTQSPTVVQPELFKFSSPINFVPLFAVLDSNLFFSVPQLPANPAAPSVSLPGPAAALSTLWLCCTPPEHAPSLTLPHYWTVG